MSVVRCSPKIRCGVKDCEMLYLANVRALERCFANRDGLLARPLHCCQRCQPVLEKDCEVLQMSVVHPKREFSEVL